MSNFEFMQETVDAICHSMENEPHMWVVNTHTTRHVHIPIEYWHSNWTEIWNGNEGNVVFSLEQATQLKKSFKILKEKQASVAQQKVIDSFKPKLVIKQESEKKPAWWWF